ncbi:hypothetical protein AB0A73_21560 [Glycomyces sp. NPDC047369]
MSICLNGQAAAAQISATIESLPGPEREVLLRHTLNPEGPSVAAISRERGILYSRMLEQERHARKRIAETCRTPVVQAVARAAEQLTTGVLRIPRLLQLIPALKCGVGGIPLWRILVRTTLHLWEQGGWIAPRPIEQAAADCAGAIAALMDEHGIAPLYVVADDLPDRLAGEDAGRWLVYCGFTVRAGYVVAPPRTLADKAARYLAVTGVPCHFDEIYQHIGHGKSRDWVRTAMWRDPRLMKADVRTWGLTAWGLDPYTSVADLVHAQLDAEGGAMPLSELVAVITARSDVHRTSVYDAAARPPFTVVGGTLTRLPTVAAKRKEPR